MEKQLPEFLTCPVCKKTLPSSRVINPAVVDREKTVICVDCMRITGHPQLLVEDVPGRWGCPPGA
jgi:uncharacterized protein YbaR (Trm112 family)